MKPIKLVVNIRFYYALKRNNFSHYLNVNLDLKCFRPEVVLFAQQKYPKKFHHQKLTGTNPQFNLLGQVYENVCSDPSQPASHPRTACLNRFRFFSPAIKRYLPTLLSPSLLPDLRLLMLLLARSTHRHLDCEDISLIS